MVIHFKADLAVNVVELGGGGGGFWQSICFLTSGS